MTCTWEADPACLGDEWDALPDEDKQRALMLATSALQGLTNNRVGTCPITIRPCVRPTSWACDCDFSSYRGLDGNWFSHCDHGIRTCGPLSEIDIPGPVGYISEFKINGVPQVLDSGDWRLDDGHLLVWQGSGPSPVPSSQDMNKPDTAPGTWSITYSRSYPVNEDARIAVAYLAMEFVQACKPRGKCSLPRGVTNVVRSGVSFTVQAGLFPNGLTNIDQTDQFILKWVPPGSPVRGAQVFDVHSIKTRPRVTSAVPLRGPSGSA